ncbi:hypothetical protein GFM44_30970 [Rhizobium leguminosarum bv. viciae]|nr:hypothetical protein [Rhizobium leguminosarum bv. viciae]
MRKDADIADIGIFCRDCPFPFKHSVPAMFLRGGSDTPFPLGQLDKRGGNYALNVAFSPEDEVQQADGIRIVQLIPPDLETPEGESPVAVVVARGQFASTGWTGEVLLERAYDNFPADGILEFDLVAVKPRSHEYSLTFLTAASQIAVTRGFRGVRVHGKFNEIEALLLT